MNYTNSMDKRIAQKPRQGELKNMPAPAHGVPSVRVKDAEQFLRLMLNFVTYTGSTQGALRAQWLDGGRYVVTSYGTPIGYKEGKTAFLNTTAYSQTTARHQDIIREAWDDVSEVPATEFPTF